MGWFDRLKDGLKGTRANLGPELTAGRTLDWDELEFGLIAADVGATAAAAIVADAKDAHERGDTPQAAVQQALVDRLEPNRMRQSLRRVGFALQGSQKPVEPSGRVIMVVGVNGVGKTTSIAKLGRYYTTLGKSVAFAAGDTFRAAGSEQLAVWGERLNIPTRTGAQGSDPGAVAFEAAQARAAEGRDLLIVDTAGRLHTQHNLMQELVKVKRVIGKADEGEPKDVWLVLDAVTGQNGLNQAKRFHEAVGLTGVIVTKLDGTAKGGILVPIVQELGVPIKFVGVGESDGDLQPFDPVAYATALVGLDAQAA